MYCTTWLSSDITCIRRSEVQSITQCRLVSHLPARFDLLKRLPLSHHICVHAVRVHENADHAPACSDQTGAQSSKPASRHLPGQDIASLTTLGYKARSVVERRLVGAWSAKGTCISRAWEDAQDELSRRGGLGQQRSQMRAGEQLLDGYSAVCGEPTLARRFWRRCPWRIVACTYNLQHEGVTCR
jgi:hypothetical protein